MVQIHGKVIHKRVPGSMNVAEAILAQGADAANTVIYGTAAMFYGQLREVVARVAVGLWRRGCQKGDRVGICAENSPFSMVLR